MKPIRSAVPRKEALKIEGGDQDWKLYLIQVQLKPGSVHELGMSTPDMFSI